MRSRTDPQETRDWTNQPLSVTTCAGICARPGDRRFVIDRRRVRGPRRLDPPTKYAGILKEPVTVSTWVHVEQDHVKDQINARVDGLVVKAAKGATSPNAMATMVLLPSVR